MRPKGGREPRALKRFKLGCPKAVEGLMAVSVNREAESRDGHSLQSESSGFELLTVLSLKRPHTAYLLNGTFP